MFAGHVPVAGNPRLAACTHAAATATGRHDPGACLALLVPPCVAKTVTEELARVLTGENTHMERPRNA